MPSNVISLVSSPKLVANKSKLILFPLIGILMFLMFWHLSARQVETSLGTLPGPVQTYHQFSNLVNEHWQERDKEQAFIERQEKRNAAKLAKNPEAKVKIRPYTGKPTFFDQIITSLITVAAGFLLATLLAIPLGIMLGLNQGLYQAFNPIIQLLKPVSPLAWLPIVTMVVSATYVSDDPLFAKSFINSLLTVALCSLWPTLINTAVGVTSVDKDLINVSKVLQLSWWQHIRTIVLPSAIPMIFTGLRLSLGIAWMVLIAAEMLAQNPGLGKFVWDEFQNGSSASLGRIMVAVITIGFIGLMLDRGMLQLQKWLSWNKQQALR
ncbi:MULTISPECIES: ABC transporter permease [Vibrio]|uniref:Nitrate ABC transporter permease n=1 Tax=Vibrio coralliilyticus TaxID=190893 RepID=A0AAN0SHZ1_9VIBR|nr:MULTISPECIES: ABC transporter permease [Vibrio]AIW21495.1 nitrate ABC transporter permease [Vibrio coralliilyticus]EEX33451.1 nitrate ABC transporter permease protein [Vibrio coralliilyticus ATCC BAA-450]MCM5508301.1 ABC transporter permease [Vibrio sp. SCSIO 43169]MDE3897007.1 ABC transporter permease [Vibrio sp. CC007]NOH42014.1 ABC transporter permease [Vibrio coralliilyticus]